MKAVTSPNANGNLDAEAMIYGEHDDDHGQSCQEQSDDGSEELEHVNVV